MIFPKHYLLSNLVVFIASKNDLVSSVVRGSSSKILYMSYPGPSCSKRRQLNELVKGHFVNCFSGFNIQYSDIFC